MAPTPHPPGETSTPRAFDARLVEPVLIEPAEPPAARDDVKWRDVRWVEFGLSDDSAADDEAQTWSVSRVPRSRPEPVEPEHWPEIEVEHEIPLRSQYEPKFVVDDLPEFPDDAEFAAGPANDAVAAAEPQDDVDWAPEPVAESDYPPEPGYPTAAEFAAYPEPGFDPEFDDEQLELQFDREAVSAGTREFASEETDAWGEAGTEVDFAPELIEPTFIWLPDDDEPDEFFARYVAPPSRSARVLAGLARLRDSARVRAQSLSRVTVAAGVLAILAGAAYYGGDHIAGLAGAMTRPQAPVIETAVAGPAAIAPPPKAEAAPAPPAPPIDEATARAISYLDRAKKGDMVAQYDVAVMYARGDGLAQDFTSAAAWFARAAEAGSASAQFNLGVLYERGLGVRKDVGEAFLWYRRSADRHYAPAQYNLAVAYADGKGTPPDPVAAARWYREAAVQGLVAAMINFAILYEKGDGVDRSPIDAYAWYKAAGQRGDAVADKRAAELLAQFDAAKKRQAQTQAMAIAGAIRQSAPEMTPLPTAPAGVTG